MARNADLNPETALTVSPPLPPVDWASIGRMPPRPIVIGPRRPEDRLPVADVAILTWTSAEWAALNHVFLGGANQRTSDNTWKKAWLPYTRGAAGYTADPKSGALWGFFQLVEIVDRSTRPWRVLLFKSNSHLAHPPWIPGLSAMTRAILEDTKADRIYSIGTAGGSRLSQRLGDSVVTICAQLDLQRPQNSQDPDNGGVFRCKTWFPATALLPEVERSLLYRMNQTVTNEALEELLGELKAKHPGDAAVAALGLADLVNDPIRPEQLGAPRVLTLKNAPLLTTDFYYIAGGDGADPFSFLEMDDAVIAREAERMGARYAFIRNISDPIVGSVTQSGQKLTEDVRADWSGLIYTRYGLLTSFNGALATWATIAGEGESAYVPPRSVRIAAAGDPLEVKLPYQVRSCGSCQFFWPEKKTQQTYGPYTAYDFDVNAPYAARLTPGPVYSPWVLGRTRPPAFPEAEVLDGCWKAPIMTIGINPNLTAFSPGQAGASWCYPSFSSDNGTDEWAKYAWYYRYRSVCQERLDLDFVRRFILPEGRILAPAPGHVTVATRLDSNAAWTVKVRYDGDAADTDVTLPGKTGDFPYVLLFDQLPPNNVFKAGDLLAGRLAVPGGIRVEVQQQPQSYYMQFVPVLQQFQESLRKQGHLGATLRVGEDACQLDMVACASPHWNKGYLGGSDEGVQTIVDNCVTRNAWAIKQLALSRPKVLYIVSLRSWRMFRDAFGAHVRRDPPLSTAPVDNDFTLLRETTDPAHPCYFEFRTEIDGQAYECVTRLVITPHFSYNYNFQPQYRMSPGDWQHFSQTEPASVAAMTLANGFQIVPPDPQHPTDYTAVRLPADPAKADAARLLLAQQFPAAYAALQPYYYDPHALMAGVLDDLLAQGALSWQTGDDGAGFLARTPGSCQFCDNQRWKLPFGCPYGKPKEPPPPPGFLEQVAERMVATGKPLPTIATPPGTTALGHGDTDNLA
jgi:nucleoside phosphorylase